MRTTAASVTIFAVACAIFLYRRSKKDGDSIKRLETLQFELQTLRGATEDFSDAAQLGQGGSGAVYKSCLPDGHIIAVKRLSGYSVQGEEQFRNEILLAVKLQHISLWLYMAPEYALHGHIPDQSDVFSFGEEILETLSAKKNGWLDSSANVIWKNWRDSILLNVIDPTLEATLGSEIMRCIHIGLLCSRKSRR